MGAEALDICQFPARDRHRQRDGVVDGLAQPKGENTKRRNENTRRRRVLEKGGLAQAGTGLTRVLSVGRVKYFLIIIVWQHLAGQIRNQRHGDQKFGGIALRSLRNIGDELDAGQC